MKTFLVLLVLTLVTSCANELSPEKKARELADREYSRLEKAAGVYSGFLQSSETEIAPVAVTVIVQKNPTSSGEKPLLLVVLKTGLFGGVTVPSSSAAFDFGTKEISAAFNAPKKDPNAAGNPSNSGNPTNSGTTTALEFKATIENDSLVNPLLTGAHQGVHKLKLSKQGKDLFSSKVEYKFLVSIAEEDGEFGKTPQGVMTVKIRKDPEPGTSTSDLPIFPGLEASLSFNSFAATPQVATSVLYDPIVGTMDLQFSSVSLIRLKHVYLTLDTASEKLLPPEIHGEITLGGAKLRDVVLKESFLQTTLVAVPPKTYVGIFQGDPNGVVFKTVAYLNYQGGTAKNPLEFPFLNFPSMQMDVVVCLGDSDAQKMILKLDNVDYLSRKGLFRKVATPGESPFEFKWSDNFRVMDGTFHETGGGGTNLSQPHMKLVQRSEEGFKGCAEPPNP